MNVKVWKLKKKNSINSHKRAIWKGSKLIGFHDVFGVTMWFDGYLKFLNMLGLFDFNYNKSKDMKKF